MLTEPGKHPWEKLYVWGSEPQLHATGLENRCPHCWGLVELMRIGDTEEQLLCTHYEPCTEDCCTGSGLIVSTIGSREQMCAEIEQRIERAIRKLNSGESEHATGEPG